MAAERDVRRAAFAVLLESSSSDSSEDEIVEFLMNYRKANKRPKIVNYIAGVVDFYSDEEFRRNFRLRWNTVQLISERFKRSQFFPNNIGHGGREAISADTHVLSFLWFAGNKCCMRDVASRFGIAESAFFRVFQRVLDFILEIAPTIIKFPSTQEEKEKIEEEFRMVAGFPGVLGCIDGSYISIRTPAKKIKSTYTNRHDMTSITLQGICDAQRKFIDVFTGIPSKIHDSRVLRLSFIDKNLQKLCEPQYHLMGDAAYPLREWLLKPYPEFGNLTEEKKNTTNDFALPEF